MEALLMADRPRQESRLVYEVYICCPCPCRQKISPKIKTDLLGFVASKLMRETPKNKGTIIDSATGSPWAQSRTSGKL